MRIFITLLCIVFVCFASIEAQSQSKNQCPVREAQAILKALGYELGTVDGIWGPASSRAVSSFQKDQGLPVTGKLDAVTCSGIAAAKKSAKIETPLDKPTMIGWSDLEQCRYLRDRQVRNRLLVNRYCTKSLEGERMILSSGQVRGGPYDAMGVGTYVRLEGETEVCGIRFSGGGFTVTKDGFRLDSGTKFEK